MSAVGIVFSSINEKSVYELTKQRTMASVPFGCRYRLIDFALSNMVNSGINHVGLITHYNYQSLMDHIGTGKDWDLARRHGGIKILPPYITAFANASNFLYSTRLEALISIRDFISDCKEDIVVLSDCDTVCNLDLNAMIDYHVATGAEITLGVKSSYISQDTDRAVIMGQRTYGKGLVQGTRHVGYNGYLKYTTAKYYIPSGRCIQSRNYNHGGKSTIVPDSLISEFHTRGGRKVYDGGGIVPDIKIEPEYVSRFALTLYAMGYMEDWADEYMRKHHDEVIDVRTFRLTDEDYADFCRFVEERDVPYESETRRALASLEKAAENDRYDESLKEAIATLKGLIKDDKMSNMQTYREEIEEAITADVILRFAYSEGVMEHSAVNDAMVEQAVELLLNSEEHTRILSEQDLDMH